MRCLITTVKQSVKGGEIRKPRSLDCIELSIGRGADQILHVPDMQAALEHARIRPAGKKKFRLQALTPAGILHNDRRVQRALVKPGDELQIAGTRIVLLAPDAAHDLAADIHLPDDAATATGAPPARSVLRGKLTRRRLSWLLFLLVLLIGMGLPLLGFYVPELRATLRDSPVPDDSLWLAGPLSSAHQYFGSDCNVCHQQAFRPASDETCKTCHTDAHPHARITDQSQPELAAEDCESCHREHNGDIGIIPRNQSLCSDCHQESMGHSGQTDTLAAVSDFGVDHPQFKASLIRFDATGVAETERVALDAEGLREESMLTFPHDAHLDPAGIEAPDGEVVMECIDCHRTDAGGRLMAPINFENHCGACHQLNFDPSHPDRMVPHGKPAEVVDVLTEFYSELGLRGAGREVEIDPLESSDPAQVLMWARRQALRTGDALFQDRACGECHQVSRQDSENRVSWEVEPARVAGIWFPKAQFDHASHTAMKCLDCHAALDSDSSEDVLLPGIETCRECHAGEQSENRLASACISCHRFHNPEPMAPAAALGANSGVLYLWDRPDVERIIRQRRGPETRRRRPGQDH